MADHIIVTAPVTFKRWRAPNFASLDKESGGIAVEDLAPQVLDALAQDWLNQLYAKVGRSAPRLSAPEGER